MLAAECRVVVVDHDGDAVVIQRQCDNVDALGLIMVGDRLVDDQVVLGCILLFKSGLQQCINVRFGAPIADRRLIRINIDDAVVDFEADERRHDMLDGVDAGVADTDRRTP